MVGASSPRKFSPPGAPTIEGAERTGIRPVMNEARPAVQLAWPYQLVNMAPSLAMRSMLGRFACCASAGPPSAARAARTRPAASAAGLLDIAPRSDLQPSALGDGLFIRSIRDLPCYCSIQTRTACASAV